VDVVDELPPALPLSAADGDLLSRAIENVLDNALEAMPAGGVLTLRAAAHRSEGVELCIADSGCGIDARSCERVFEDFYTTKATGSGLGLAFVRRVVEAHGGRVALLSGAGCGTRVRIEIPCTPNG
jgi:signal transduction histidine kinase